MLSRFSALLLLVCWLAVSNAQAETPARYQIYGGYTYLSNSFNGFPGARQSLNGWDAAASFAAWHHLRFKLETYHYGGTNQGAPQNAQFIMGGGQYGRRFGREYVFTEALFGDAGLNKNWGPNQATGSQATFAILLGGGLDTPISRHFAYRVTGGFQYAYPALNQLAPPYQTYRPAGLPEYFGRISTGLVWQF
jgi:hypothetical protein